MLATISARFVHDCDECTFFGRLGKYDIYRHVRFDRPSEEDNLILRFSGDGPDYRCFSVAIVRQLPEDGPFRTALAMTE